VEHADDGNDGDIVVATITTLDFRQPYIVTENVSKVFDY
jgi:hypothetical protein